MKKMLARKIFSGTLRVARGTALALGVGLMLTLVLGVAATALAGTGVGATFNLGQANTVNKISSLIGSASSAMLKIDNNGAGPALALQVESGKQPMTVNAGAGKVTNLNADKLDGKSSTDFYAAGSKVADSTHADQADLAREAGIANAAGDADLLDGKDSAQFVQGNGITKRGQADLGFNDFTTILNITSPDVEMQYTCSSQSTTYAWWSVTNKSGSERLSLFMDDGSSDPQYAKLSPNGQVIDLTPDNTTFGARASGDHLTFHAQSATGTATIEAFSVTSGSGCHAQAQALVTR